MYRWLFIGFFKYFAIILTRLVQNKQSRKLTLGNIMRTEAMLTFLLLAFSIYGTALKLTPWLVLVYNHDRANNSHYMHNTKQLSPVVILTYQ